MLFRRNAATRRRLITILSFTFITILILICVHHSDELSKKSRRALKYVNQNFQFYTETNTVTEILDAAILHFNEAEQNILKEQRKMIENEMKSYNYSKRNIRSLRDLTPATGGTPLRHILLTSWRSGSTFLGAVLDAHPGTWYHYEPLLDLGIVKIRGPPLADKAVKTIKELLKCNFTAAEGYNKFMNKYDFVLKSNKRVWKYCEGKNRKLCKNPEFLSAMCNQFPIQTMKIVRMRLEVAEALLKDRKLNVKMTLLVRDPRGTVRSRKSVQWCKEGPDCYDSGILCEDLQADYITARKLTKRYRDRFRVIRYEDLSTDVEQGVKTILNDLDLDMHKDISDYLDTHTKDNKGNNHSTFRDSKTAAFKWRTESTFSDVQKVQEVCGQAMKSWGYVVAKDEEHLKTFNPITSYKLK